MRLYSKEELDKIPWPETEDGDYARRYLEPMMRDGTEKYISNVKAEIYILIFNNKCIPIVLPAGGDKRNCYVCSPTSHYITYAFYETEILESKWLRVSLRLIIRLLSVWLKIFKVEKVVYVNNWFLSTNLWIDLTKDELEEITRLIQASFIGRVILFRSINTYTNGELMERLDNLHYRKIISRQVYIADARHPSYRKKNNFKNDKRLLNKTPYSVVRADALAPSDYKRIVQLYDYLYLEKYTHLNPQFTEALIAKAVEEDILTVIALKLEGEIDAVLGYFKRNNVITPPLFGFDTTKPNNLGLYRLISMLVMLEAEERNAVLNQSSGAAEFKRGRGFQPYLEYSMYRADHVPLPQRVGWRGLSKLMNALLEPTLTRNEL